MNSHSISCTCIPILTENLRVPELAMIVCSYIPREYDEHILSKHIGKTMSAHFSNVRSRDRFCISMNLYSTYGNDVFVRYTRFGTLGHDAPYDPIRPFTCGWYVPSAIISYRFYPGNIHNQEHIDAEAAVRADMDARIQSILRLPHYWHK